MFRSKRPSVYVGAWVILAFLSAVGTSHTQVPPPEQILGFKVGDDYHLATYEQAVQYFKELENTSPLMKVFEMGETSMGKTMIKNLHQGRSVL